MKPRALRTYKILAVALTAAAGCTRASGPEPNADPPGEPIKQEVQAQRVADPAPQESASALATSPPLASAAPSLDQFKPEDPVLVTLRAELRAQKREIALAQTARFRPLCDKDGYPLVGNAVMGKGDLDLYQPSEFCHDIRQRAQR